MSSADHASKAVVFAYHDVGVRCLEVLLDSGVDIGLVVTHADDPDENIWFGSVAETARRNKLPVVMPKDPNTTEFVDRIRQLAPDLLFSFYYRHMLDRVLISIPTIGAFNMHGSLLPKYRGRVPVNWAVLHGERESGVSLHRMTEKPDAGDLVAQSAVPVLINDTAGDVFSKLTVAAESVLLASLPGLLDGSLTGEPLDLAAGSYFGGRRPEDGRIDWSMPAVDIHNLIRAVAPPYPGAFFDIEHRSATLRIHIMGSYYRELPAINQGSISRGSINRGPRIYFLDGQAWADCIDGVRLMLTRLETDQGILTESGFRKLFGDELRPGQSSATEDTK